MIIIIIITIIIIIIIILDQVTTQTLDPFSGVIYAGTSSLGGKGAPGCKVEGRGRHSLTIGVKVFFQDLS